MLESYRHLHLVIFNSGTIPSLAIWKHSDPEPVLRHFLHPGQRDSYIEHLLYMQRLSPVVRAAYRVMRRLLKLACIYLP